MRFVFLLVLASLMGFDSASAAPVDSLNSAMEDYKNVVQPLVSDAIAAKMKDVLGEEGLALKSSFLRCQYVKPDAKSKALSTMACDAARGITFQGQHATYVLNVRSCETQYQGREDMCFNPSILMTVNSYQGYDRYGNAESCAYVVSQHLAGFMKWVQMDAAIFKVSVKNAVTGVMVADFAIPALPAIKAAAIKEPGYCRR